MDFASAFNDQEVGETRCSAAFTNKSSVVVIPPANDDTHDDHLFESLMLDTSVHTIGLNYDSVEHQLSLLERDSDDLFDSLLGTRRKGKQNTSSSLLQEFAGTFRRNSISFTFNEDLACNDIDDLFKIYDTVVADEGFTSRYNKNEEESSNSNDFLSSILVSTESSLLQDKNKKEPTVEAMHAFNQEYESRLNDLRQCMSRTKSSRSRVAKLKQAMKQRCLNKYSFRNKLVKSVGINTSYTDYSRQKLLQSQMYLNQVSNSSLQSTTGDELSRHTSSRSNSPYLSHAITLE